MKRFAYYLFGVSFLLCTSQFFAKDSSAKKSDDPVVQQYLDAENGEGEKKESQYVMKEKIFPEPKRPSVVNQEMIQEVIDKYPEHAEQKYIDDCNNLFKYGIEDQIKETLSTIIMEEDPRFADAIYDMFLETKVVSIKQAVLKYFTKIKDPCLEDYAVEIINDPYDTKNTIVSECFAYVAAVKSEAAVPGVVDLLDKEEEDYFTAALSCLGDIGGEEEGVFVAEYLDRDDLTVAQKQALVRVLGKLKAVSTYDKLVEMAEDENENSYVRMYSAEAIGAMKGEGAEDILVGLFESEDPNLRVYVIKGIVNFEDDVSNKILIQGLRDSHYKVRIEAVNAVEQRKLAEAIPYLIYRCKDSSENQQVKDKCYTILSDMNTAEGNEYLVGLITDAKTGDTAKGKVAAALLKNGYAGTSEIVELADKTLQNDIHKQLRYTLGKEFAKYGRSEFEEVCGKYLAHKDVMTQGTGLDIYNKGKYSSLTEKVQAIADNDGTGVKRNANAKKAKRILGIPDETEEKKDEKTEDIKK